MSASPHHILKLMDRLRRRTRILVLLSGLLGFASCLLAGFLVLGLVDWLVWLPPMVRLVLSLALLCGLGHVALKYMVRPLVAPLSRVALASRLEYRYHHLGNRLSSAVQFLESPPRGSADMMGEVVRRAQGDVCDLDFDDAFAYRILWRRSAGALISVVGLLLLATVLPYWPRVALARLAYPFGNTIWPRTVQIAPLAYTAKVPTGGSFTPEMRVERGDRPKLRAFVHVRHADRREDTFPMQRGAEGIYRWTLEGLTQDAYYWFEAGDDSTRNKPGLIQIVPRPAVESVALTVRQPEYAGGEYEVRLPLEPGKVDILSGSDVRIDVRANKPIKPMEDGSPDAWIVTSGAENWPLSWGDDPERREAYHFFRLTESVGFQTQFHCKDGFQNDSSAEYQLVARIDQPPSVSVLEPTASLDVTPQSEVGLWLALTDDVGLAALSLHASVVGAEDLLPPLDLTELLLEASALATETAPAEGSLRRAEQDKREVRYSWKLSDLDLNPGDTLDYHLQVSDNFALDGADPHVVRSVPMRLRILSQAQFADRLQVEFQMLRNRLLELLTEQEALLYSAEQVREAHGGGGPLLDEANESLSRIGGAQSRLAARAGQLARQFERMVERMLRNRYEDQSAREDTKRIAFELQRLGEGVMTEAGRRADRAVQTDSPADQAAELQALVVAQQQATNTLERLLQELQRWGSFQEMVRKTQEMLDRQQETTRETADLHLRTLGIPADSLSQADREAAAALARRQDRLGDEADELLRRMADMSEATQETEPTTSESLAEAQRTAGAGSLSRRLHQAADAISRNRAGRAATEQEAAEETLKEMLRRLGDRESRQLWELTRRAEQAEDLVRYFLQQQIELRDRTQQAAQEHDPPARYAELAPEQETLEANTRQLSKDLMGDLETARPARRIRAAAGKMGSAAVRLRQAHGQEVDRFQTAAIDELEAALEALAELRRKAQQELAAQAVMAVRNKLIEIHNEELDIRINFDQVLEEHDRQGRLRRAQTRELSRMETMQLRLKGEMDGLIEQVKQVVVHKWLFERIAADMESAGQRMRQRQVNQDTAELLGRIVSALSRAIDSLDLADVEPENQFAQAGGGGGGPFQGIKPVPTVAELRLLRQMQTDINEQTVALSQETDPQRPTEKQLRRVRDLADQQAEIRRLTVKLFEGQD
ncbi:MAG: hypothetical protein JSU68_00270 [Phycisphaerales bacterium]|nr:MAG: hypothetical protein JSU68_00270 [Phycisphaerales bacterium]